MKKRLIGVFLFTFLLMVSACGESSDSKIHGTWIIDMEETIKSSPELVTMLEASPETKEQITAMLDDSSISIDTAKGTINGKMLGAEQPEVKFTILSEDSEVVIIEDELGDKMEFKIIDNDTISYDEPTGMDMKLILKRK